MPSAPDLAGARVLPCGETAVLIELSGTAAALSLARRIEARRAAAGAAGTADAASRWRHVDEVVTGERTVLVVVDSATALADLRLALGEMVCAPTGADAPAASDADPLGGVVEIPVRYDGPDLTAVADHTGLTPAGVVAAHTGTEWEVAFTGFAPGFGYLVGGDPRLAVPRLAQPRPHVPAGSVALAGTYSGVYPTESPGGWQLIGHTDTVLWDVRREPPALLRPGVRVRFLNLGEAQ